VALVPSNLKLREAKGKPASLKLVAGTTRWIAPARQASFENTGNEPAELLRFDFKTKPLSKDILEKDKKHEHSEK
jgi:hypothetical protein